MRGLWSFAPLLLVGCAQLGPSRESTLPANAHARPDPRELQEHPCRYGDVAGCVVQCEGGDAHACNGSGVLLEFGVGADLAGASHFYDLACNQSYAPGCNNLGWLYLRGRGVPHDPPHAMVLFLAAFDAARLACTRGDGDGCLLAGELLYEGRGVKQDDREAFAWFRLACEEGAARGCELANRPYDE